MRRVLVFALAPSGRVLAAVAGVVGLAVAAGACAPPPVHCPGKLAVTFAPAASDAVLGGMPLSASFFFVSASDEAGWPAAASDSAQAPTTMGFLVLSEFGGPGGQPAQLSLGLPFPLKKGQTIDVSEGEPPDPTKGIQMMKRGPGATAALAALDTCVLLKGSAVTGCAMPAGQTVTGTIDIVESRPFQARIDATFTPANATPSAALVADLSLVDTPEPCPSFF